jgi:lysophospholipase L1-like esterase
VKLKTLATGFAVALGSLVVAVGLAEIGLRFTKPGQLVIDRMVPAVGRVRVPSQRGLEFGNEKENEWVRLTINSRGLRGEEIPTAKPKGERWVLCVGDSFVFGGGLPDESTFPVQAERAWEGSTPAVRFLNAGGNGYDTRQSAAYAERFAASLEPDVIVLGWNWNDPVSIDFDLQLDLPPVWLRKFAIYKFWKYQSNPRQWQKPTPEKTQEYRDRVLACSIGPDAPRRWELVKRAVHRLAGTSKTIGAKLFVLVMPELTWKESPEFPALKTLTNYLDSLGIPWVDAQPQFHEGFKKGEHLTQNLDPFHPSAEGQALMATILTRALQERNLIPPAPERPPKR